MKHAFVPKRRMRGVVSLEYALLLLLGILPLILATFSGVLIFAATAIGLNIVVGLAGLLDLGYVAFYAVGAYSYALLATQFELSFWICLPMAGILAAFWGVLLGFPVLRLRGDYLAIVTLAFGEIMRAMGAVPPADLAGSSFTINNYGSLGVDGSAAASTMRATRDGAPAAPAFGGATIRPRWPLPIGAIRSMSRSISADLVMIEQGWPKRSITSSTLRVIRVSRSTG